ncbi:MAG TPA: diguanylate cyclase [Dongiaceae bacterium]|nr:diguanylate cyclase [Dongiaceae bacterium]
MVQRRTGELENVKFWLTIGLFVGAGIGIASILLTKLFLYRSFAKPLGEIGQGMAHVAQGNLEQQITLRGRDELSRLGRSFNSMVAELREERTSRQHAEEEVLRSNESLALRSAELEDRTRTIDLLGRMSNRLPGCADEAEFVEVIERFAPQILPGIPGILYTLSNSQTLLRQIGSWNTPQGSPAEFTPVECWGLRRGQPHTIANVSADIVCNHVDRTRVHGYRCMPLTAQGENVGLLYLEEAEDQTIDERDLAVLTETIAFALANLRLRERLRNQSVRDPLTDLFNRRYLEETLELEFSRTRRDQRPLSVIMLDIDHFKRFNDLHGHDAGDLVLKAVGQLLKRTIRTGDVPCRYGGEEFILVLPGNTVEEAGSLAERIRGAAEEIEINHKNAPLGKITVSLGIAAFPQSGATVTEVLNAADQALYQAKRNGRNQSAMAPDAERKSEAAAALSP